MSTSPRDNWNMIVDFYNNLNNFTDEQRTAYYRDTPITDLMHKHHIALHIPSVIRDFMNPPTRNDRDTTYDDIFQDVDNNDLRIWRTRISRIENDLLGAIDARETTADRRRILAELQQYFQSNSWQDMPEDGIRILLIECEHAIDILTYNLFDSDVVTPGTSRTTLIHLRQLRREIIEYLRQTFDNPNPAGSDDESEDEGSADEGSDDEAGVEAEGEEEAGPIQQDISPEQILQDWNQILPHLPDSVRAISDDGSEYANFLNLSPIHIIMDMYNRAGHIVSHSAEIPESRYVGRFSRFWNHLVDTLRTRQTNQDRRNMYADLEGTDIDSLEEADLSELPNMAIELEYIINILRDSDHAFYPGLVDGWEDDPTDHIDDLQELLNAINQRLQGTTSELPVLEAVEETVAQQPAAPQEPEWRQQYNELVRYIDDTGGLRDGSERARLGLETLIRYYNMANELEFAADIRHAEDFNNVEREGISDIVTALADEIDAIQTDDDLREWLAEMQRYITNPALISSVSQLSPAELLSLSIRIEFFLNILNNTRHPFYARLTRDMNSINIPLMIQRLEFMKTIINDRIASNAASQPAAQSVAQPVQPADNSDIRDIPEDNLPLSDFMVNTTSEERRTRTDTDLLLAYYNDAIQSMVNASNDPDRENYRNIADTLFADIRSRLIPNAQRNFLTTLRRLIDSPEDLSTFGFGSDQLRRLSIRIQYITNILETPSHPFYAELVGDMTADQIRRFIADLDNLGDLITTRRRALMNAELEEESARRAPQAQPIPAPSYASPHPPNPRTRKTVAKTATSQKPVINQAIMGNISTGGDLEELAKLLPTDPDVGNRMAYLRVALDDKRFEHAIALLPDAYMSTIATIFPNPPQKISKELQNKVRVMTGYIHATAEAYVQAEEIYDKLLDIYHKLVAIIKPNARPYKTYQLLDPTDKAYTHQSPRDQPPPQPRFLTSKTGGSTWRWHYFLWVRMDNAFDAVVLKDTEITPANFEQHVPPYADFSHTTYNQWKNHKPLKFKSAHHSVIGWTKRKIADAIVDSGLIPYQAYEHQIERLKPTPGYFKSASRNPQLQKALQVARDDIHAGIVPPKSEADIYLPSLLAMNARYEHHIVYGFIPMLRKRYDVKNPEIRQIIEDLSNMYYIRLAKSQRERQSDERKNLYRRLSYVQYMDKFVKDTTIKKLFFNHYATYRQKIADEVVPYRVLGMQQYTPAAPKFYFIFIYRSIFETVNISTQLAIFTKYDRKKPYDGQYYAPESIDSEEYYCEFNDPQYGREDLLRIMQDYFGGDQKYLQRLKTMHKTTICKLLLHMKLKWIRRFFRRASAINDIINNKLKDINAKYGLGLKLEQMPPFIRILRYADQGLIKYTMDQWILFERALIMTVNQIYKALALLDGFVGKVIEFSTVDENRYIYFNYKHNVALKKSLKAPFPETPDFMYDLIKESFGKIRVNPSDLSSNFSNIINHADLFKNQIYGAIEYMYGGILDTLQGYCNKRFANTDNLLPMAWGMDPDDPEDWNNFLTPREMMISPMGDCWDISSYLDSVKNAKGSNMTHLDVTNNKTIEMWPDFWTKEELINYGEKLQQHPSGLGKDMKEWFQQNIPELDWKLIKANPAKYIPREFVELLREVGSILWLRGPVFNTLLQKELSPKLLAEWNSKIRGMTLYERPTNLSPELADALIRIQEEYRFKFAEYYYNDPAMTTELRQAIGIYIYKEFGKTTFRSETIYRCFRQGKECVMVMGSNMIKVYNELAPLYGLSVIPTADQAIVAVATEPAPQPEQPQIVPVIAVEEPEPAVPNANESENNLSMAIVGGNYKAFTLLIWENPDSTTIYNSIIHNDKCDMMRYMHTYSLNGSFNSDVVSATLMEPRFWMVKYMIYMGYWRKSDIYTNIPRILPNLSHQDAQQFLCENFLTDPPADGSGWDILSVMSASFGDNWRQRNPYLDAFSAYLEDPTLVPVDGDIAQHILDDAEIDIFELKSCTRAELGDIFDTIVRVMTRPHAAIVYPFAGSNLQTIFGHVVSTYVDISFMLNHPGMRQLLIANDFIWHDDFNDAIKQANDAIIQDLFTLLPNELSFANTWHVWIFINAIYHRNSIPVLKGLVARGAYTFMTDDLGQDIIEGNVRAGINEIQSNSLIYLAFQRGFTRAAKYLVRVLNRHYPPMHRNAHLRSVLRTAGASTSFNQEAIIMILANYPGILNSPDPQPEYLDIPEISVYMTNYGNMVSDIDAIIIRHGDLVMDNTSTAIYDYVKNNVPLSNLRNILLQLPLERIKEYMQWLIDFNAPLQHGIIVLNYIKDMYLDYSIISNAPSIDDYVTRTLNMSFDDETLDPVIPEANNTRIQSLANLAREIEDRLARLQTAVNSEDVSEFIDDDIPSDADEDSEDVSAFIDADDNIPSASEVSESEDDGDTIFRF